MHDGKFNSCDLSRSDFSHSNLTNSTSKSSNLDNCIFENANLTGTLFKSTNLKGVTFKNSIYNKSHFLKAVIYLVLYLMGKHSTKPFSKVLH
ncbi:pentapeptide repeat-containing protein [Peribacillus simplex]|uniref:Pentapeptide repeat-containing protein n=2 Tax=Peribacillus TaxID=2675229 RepID=A0AA90PMB4_9BACI|nr:MULTISPECIES: pentapeptide repeat-containing protein [Peribacillus]MDP1420681.1 pentapeptide repeat-containing protein [Peribacillus simplex]MDP1453155.1 pentapeptide repeat-containing protein [Peribacillus frigoritolerans]